MPFQRTRFRGVSITEYGMILALVGVGAIVGLGALGGALSSQSMITGKPTVIASSGPGTTGPGTGSNPTTDPVAAPGADYIDLTFTVKSADGTDKKITVQYPVLTTLLQNATNPETVGSDGTTAAMKAYLKMIDKLIADLKDAGVDPTKYLDLINLSNKGWEIVKAQEVIYDKLQTLGDLSKYNAWELEGLLSQTPIQYNGENTDVYNLMQRFSIASISYQDRTEMQPAPAYEPGNPAKMWGEMVSEDENSFTLRVLDRETGQDLGYTRSFSKNASDSIQKEVVTGTDRNEDKYDPGRIGRKLQQDELRNSNLEFGSVVEGFFTYYRDMNMAALPVELRDELVPATAAELARLMLTTAKAMTPKQLLPVTKGTGTGSDAVCSMGNGDKKPKGCA